MSHRRAAVGNERRLRVPCDGGRSVHPHRAAPQWPGSRRAAEQGVGPEYERNAPGYARLIQAGHRTRTV
jgi:hypothetical protein